MDDRTLKNYVGVFFLCVSIISLVLEIIAYKCDWSLKSVITFCVLFFISLILFIGFIADPDNTKDTDGGYFGC